MCCLPRATKKNVYRTITNWFFVEVYTIKLFNKFHSYCTLLSCNCAKLYSTIFHFTILYCTLQHLRFRHYRTKITHHIKDVREALVNLFVTNVNVHGRLVIRSPKLVKNVANAKLQYSQRNKFVLVHFRFVSFHNKIFVTFQYKLESSGERNQSEIQKSPKPTQHNYSFEV